MSNRSRRTTICQTGWVRDEIIQVGAELTKEISFRWKDDRALVRPHNDTLVVTIDVVTIELS